MKIIHRHKMIIKARTAEGAGAATICKEILGDDGLPVYTALQIERFVKKNKANWSGDAVST